MSRTPAPRRKLVRRQRRLAMMLRLVGVVDSAALSAVLMPGAMMADVHEALGLGVFPQESIAGYLARTTSVLYSMFGLLMLYLSFHVVQYQSLIQFVAGLFAACGLAFVGIDIVESMPLWWTATEGPVVFTVGVSLVWMSRQCEAAERDLAAEGDARPVGVDPGLWTR